VQGGRTPAAPANSAASQAAKSTVLFVTNAHTRVQKRALDLLWCRAAARQQHLRIRQHHRQQNPRFCCNKCTHMSSKACIEFAVVQGGRTPAAPANSAASQAAESTVLFVTNAHTHVFKNVHWIYCGVGRPPLLQMHTHVFKNVHWICCAAGRPHASSACGPGSSMGRKDCILPAPKGSPRQPFEPHLRPCPLLLW